MRFTEKQLNKRLASHELTSVARECSAGQTSVQLLLCPTSCGCSQKKTSHRVQYGILRSTICNSLTHIHAHALASARRRPRACVGRRQRACVGLRPRACVVVCKDLGRRTRSADARAWWTHGAWRPHGARWMHGAQRTHTLGTDSHSFEKNVSFLSVPVAQLVKAYVRGFFVFSKVLEFKPRSSQITFKVN